MILQVPAWMSFVITATYAMLIVLVVAGLQRTLNWNGVSDRSRVLSWGVGSFLTGWVLFALILGLQGFFITDSTARVPGITYAFIPFALSIGWSFVSPTFLKVVDGIPPQWIVGVQSNRILGALFLVGYAQGLLPAQFAIPAGVGDLLVGLAAPIVAYLFSIKHRWAPSIGLLWNIFGIIDLLVAIATGVLTSPGPLQRLAFDTPNLLMSSYPFVVIPAFGVPVWLLLHFFSLRGLKLERTL